MVEVNISKSDFLVSVKTAIKEWINNDLTVIIKEQMKLIKINLCMILMF